MSTNTSSTALREALEIESQSSTISETQIPFPPVSVSSDPHGHVTTRVEHIVTENGHAIIAGRTGASFQYCEDEPIRTPGAIQSFGVMIVLREQSRNQLVVRAVSENSDELMGYSPRQLFELGSFCDIMISDQADTLLAHLNFVRGGAYSLEIDGPEVFPLSIVRPNGESCRLWCAAHACQTHKDLIICEFELEDDEVNPPNNHGAETPLSPTNTLDVLPTAERFTASTMKISEPLRVLRSSQQMMGEAAAMEALSILSQIQEQLGQADNFDTLLNIAIGLVKELTGFHRVLIYQFDTSWNGEVVAELIDPSVTIDLYKGLHFPASDIPTQARELYKVNKVRLLYDRDQTTARLVCRTLEDLETPLDMTYAYLRAMSPVHVKYLANMRIRSSMSISITPSNKLWGLISCHSYGDDGMRVSFTIRKLCRLLGETISRNIKRLTFVSRLYARKLINTIPADTNPSSCIIASADSLMKLFDVDYGALSINGETKILSKNTDLEEVLAIVGFLRVRRMNCVVASHDIIKDFPDLHYPPGLNIISGFLYMPLSTSAGDFIVLFRRGRLTDVEWGGNPYDIARRKETIGYLEPRASFAAWRETVLSQSREWSESDMQAAAVLCLVYGKFIKFRRQREATIRNSQHETRTPLNTILKNLELALDHALDAEIRDSLTESYSAAKSLIYVIDDLLDLTNIEKKQKILRSSSVSQSVGNVNSSCDVFGPGIHAWCVSVVEEPHHKLKPDLHGFFFIKWQIFTLRGQPM
jgi:light-regulated signal transduction histidine kinase (bacteriophytochrome)